MGALGIIPIIIGVILYNWAHKHDTDTNSSINGGLTIGTALVFWFFSMGMSFVTPFSIGNVLFYIYDLLCPIFLSLYVYRTRKNKERYTPQYKAKNISKAASNDKEDKNPE